MTDTDLEKSQSPQKQRTKTSRVPQIEPREEAPKPQVQPSRSKVRILEKKQDNEDSDVINTASEIPQITKKPEDRQKRKIGQSTKPDPVVVKDTT